MEAVNEAKALLESLRAAERGMVANARAAEAQAAAEAHQDREARCRDLAAERAEIAAEVDETVEKLAGLFCRLQDTGLELRGLALQARPWLPSFASASTEHLLPRLLQLFVAEVMQLSGGHDRNVRARLAKGAFWPLMSSAEFMAPPGFAEQEAELHRVVLDYERPAPQEPEPNPDDDDEKEAA